MRIKQAFDMIQVSGKQVSAVHAARRRPVETVKVANRILWGVWQVDRPRPVGHGAVADLPASLTKAWSERHSA